jgi:predicted SnoaL-like aldol condensation-catalyzing enzyme
MVKCRRCLTTAWVTMDIFHSDTNERIVEDWRNEEPVPGRPELVNSGKF